VRKIASRHFWGYTKVGVIAQNAHVARRNLTCPLAYLRYSVSIWLLLTYLRT